MKFRNCVFLGASGLIALGFTMAMGVQGCGGSSAAPGVDSGATGSTGSDAGATGSTGTDAGATGSDSGAADAGPTGSDGGYVSAVPPSSPTGASPTSITTYHNFALHHVHLGDESDVNGLPDWYQYGYDIDGLDTTKDSKACTLYSGAPTTNQEDGPGGVDNSFGKNIVSTLLQGIVNNPSQTVTNAIVAGHFTVMMDILGLNPAANTSATGLTGALFGGVSFAQAPNAANATPTFTLTDNWPIDPAYIVGHPDSGTPLTPPISATITFTGAYQNNGVFVSGSYTDVTLSIQLEGQNLQIPIQHAIITANIPGAGDDGGAPSGTHAASGIIAGVIDAQTLEMNVQGVAGSLSTEFCNASDFATIGKEILQAADIMDDGTNVAGTPCNGISVGIGFDADEIMLPQVVGTPTVGPNPCATDAGPADAGATDQ